MSIRSTIAIILCKTSGFFLQNILKRGTSLPGKIAKKICPNIISYVSKNTDVILITGTNGKTTTTNMVYNIIKEANVPCFTNGSGANMESGIITTFINHYHPKQKQIAIIEIDEANVPLICKYVKPEAICITNLFRDQLDRYGEIYTTLSKILAGIQYHVDTTLILNADEPLLGTLNLPNPCIYYGFDITPSNEKIDINTDAKHCVHCHQPYQYDFITYNHLGKYSCKTCHYERPNLNDKVTKLISTTPQGSKVYFNEIAFEIPQAGLYNIYNALSAFSITNFLKIDTSYIQSGLQKHKSKFGRQETIQIGDVEMTILLVKNPAGFNQTIDTIKLENEPFNCIFMLNDNPADGIDVSWIYDVQLEKLHDLKMKNCYVSGKRAYDMAIRLKTANFNPKQLQVLNDLDKLTTIIQKDSTKRVYAILTYTAMLEYRRFLQSKGFIKEYWR